MRNGLRSLKEPIEGVCICTYIYIHIVYIIYKYIYIYNYSIYFIYIYNIYIYHLRSKKPWNMFRNPPCIAMITPAVAILSVPIDVTGDWPGGGPDAHAYVSRRFISWLVSQYPLVNVEKKLLKMVIYSGLTHQKWWCSIVKLVYQRVICGNNPLQTLWGFVKKNGRFVREITGSWETSGNIASCTFSQRHTRTRTRTNTHTHRC